MGTVFVLRNRFSFYRTLYDDYSARSGRLAISLSSILWLPHYWYGVYLNRNFEESYSHRIYALAYAPRRSRLAQNLIFEEFDVHLESWAKYMSQYEAANPGGQAESSQGATPAVESDE